MPDFLPALAGIATLAALGWLGIRQAIAFDRDRREEERESIEAMEEQIARGRYTASRREHA